MTTETFSYEMTYSHSGVRRLLLPVFDLVQLGTLLTVNLVIYSALIMLRRTDLIILLACASIGILAVFRIFAPARLLLRNILQDDVERGLRMLGYRKSPDNATWHDEALWALPFRAYRVALHASDEGWELHGPRRTLETLREIMLRKQSGLSNTSRNV